METPVFPDKKVLIVYPTDYNGYRERFSPLVPHFKSVVYFNYTAACDEAGPAGVEPRLAALAAAERPDLVLCCFFASDHLVSVEFLAGLRKKTAVVFWFADDATYFETYSRYYAQAADAVVTADPFAVQAYGRLEIPAVFCPEIVANNKLAPLELERDIDVLFIGDVSKRGRAEYLDHLRANGINPVVYGFGSPNGYLPFDKISEYFCRSRIVLNFCQVGELNWINEDEPLLARVRQNPGRPREIALTRSFCLSEYSPSLEASFKLGSEIDTFRDKEELLEKVRYYLANPGRRGEIAAAAYKRAEPAYRVPVYIAATLRETAAILAAGEPRLPSGGRLFLSAAFKAKAVNSLTFSFYSMLARGRALKAAAALPRLLRYGPAAFLRGFYGGTRRALALLGRKLAGGGRP